MMIVKWRRADAASPTAGGYDPDIVRETEIEDWIVAHGGRDTAEEIARRARLEDAGAFADGGTIVLLGPQFVVGTYRIATRYEPVFTATEIGADGAPTMRTRAVDPARSYRPASAFEWIRPFMRRVARSMT